jgi:hypothetical protein
MVASCDLNRDNSRGNDIANGGALSAIHTRNRQCHQDITRLGHPRRFKDLNRFWTNAVKFIQRTK